MTLDKKTVLVVCGLRNLSAQRARLLLQLLTELQPTALVRGEVRVLATGAFEPPPDLALLDVRKMRPKKPSPFPGKSLRQYNDSNRTAERRYQIRMRKRRNRR